MEFINQENTNNSIESKELTPENLKSVNGGLLGGLATVVTGDIAEGGILTEGVAKNGGILNNADVDAAVLGLNSPLA